MVHKFLNSITELLVLNLHFWAEYCESQNYAMLNFLRSKIISFSLKGYRNNNFQT
jgi:hypothetical protein